MRVVGLGLLVPVAGEFSAGPLRRSLLLGPEAHWIRDGGLRVDFSHTALNTKAKKIHKGSPSPNPPAPHSLPNPLMLLWLLQSPFRSGQGSNYEAKRIRRGLGVLMTLPSPSPSALCPRKTPIYRTARTLGGPRPGALRLLVKSCVLRLQTPSCAELHQASV